MSDNSFSRINISTRKLNSLFYPLLTHLILASGKKKKGYPSFNDYFLSFFSVSHIFFFLLNLCVIVLLFLDPLEVVQVKWKVFREMNFYSKISAGILLYLLLMCFIFICLQFRKKKKIISQTIARGMKKL